MHERVGSHPATRPAQGLAWIAAEHRPAWLAWSLPLIAALTASGAVAQTTPGDHPENQVVVTGRRGTPEKSAQSFIRKTITLNEGQLDRFIDPVCPEILGVPASLATRMQDRIRADATNAHVPVAPEKCDPNVVAVITKSGDTLMQYMRKHNNSYFADLSDVELHDVFSPGVVHSWRSTTTRDENGQVVQGDPPTLDTYASVIFSLPTQEATDIAIVVLDKSVVLDKTVAQLSDYIALRALTGARPPKKTGKSGKAGKIDPAVPTILTLFDHGETPPAEMTTADVGMMTGLYASDPMQKASSQLYEISHQMAEPSTSPPRSR